MHIDDIHIISDDTLTLLGATLDSGLTFTQHIHKLSSKANKLIHLTSKFKKFLNVKQAEGCISQWFDQLYNTVCVSYSTFPKRILTYWKLLKIVHSQNPICSTAILYYFRMPT